MFAESRLVYDDVEIVFAVLRLSRFNTNMLSWGLATEGVRERGGPHGAKADNEKG